MRTKFPFAWEASLSPLDRTRRKVEEVLDKKARDKRKKHLDDLNGDEFPFPFRPFILSAGGLAEKDAMTLALWKRPFPLQLLSLNGPNRDNSSPGKGEELSGTSEPKEGGW